MKIARSPQLQQLLEAKLEAGIARGADAAEMKALLEETGATASEIVSFLEEAADWFGAGPVAVTRADIERLLATERPDTVSGVLRAHALRAERRQQPWWQDVQGPALGPVLYTEPPRDVDVHGERITKDDLRDVLRKIGR